MGINIRQKGAEGEREVIKILTALTLEVLNDMDAPAETREKVMKMIQRNQNQTAVGGNDLTNTFGLSIEVKRQETLSVGTWWAQCVAAAKRNNELPVLMYRQNRKPWKIRTHVFLTLPAANGGWQYTATIGTLEMDEFKDWFKKWVKAQLLSGYEIRA